MDWGLVVFCCLILGTTADHQIDEFDDWLALDDYNKIDSHLPHGDVPDPGAFHQHSPKGHQDGDGQPGGLWGLLKKQQHAGRPQAGTKNTNEEYDDEYDESYPKRPFDNGDDYHGDIPLNYGHGMPPFQFPPQMYGHMHPMYPYMYQPYLPPHMYGQGHGSHHGYEDIVEDLNDSNRVNHPGKSEEVGHHPGKGEEVGHEGLKRPSQSAHAGHLPEDIRRFLEMAMKLQAKYGGDKMVNGRQGRFMDPINTFLALNPLTAWLVGSPLKEVAAEIEQTKTGVLDSLMAPFNNLLVGKASSIQQNVLIPKAEDLIIDTAGTDVKMAGVETCSNGDAVCDDYQTCINNGGTPIGSCYNCHECSTCCKYVYEGESNTCAAPILFFQSEEYPLTRSDYYSSSISIRIRPDVCQVLIEFIDFELPIGKHGCFEDAYLEIINPMMPEGILGKGNSRLCGINTDQHLYLPVRGGDQLLMKVTTSGNGYNEYSGGDDNGNYREYSDDFRFKIKVTQIIDKSSFKQVAVTSGNLLATAYQQNPVLASFLRKNELLAEAFPFVVQQLPTKDVVVLFANIRASVPQYYQNLMAPEGCLQYYLDETGIVESFNYDGKSSMPKNLDYTICFKHHKHCGMSLKAIKFDIPACRKECMDGTAAIAGGFPCCTAGLQNHNSYGKDNDQDIEKWIGIDGTSDGKSRHKENQKRFFFCGKSLGHTNYIESDRQGPLHIQVYSDGKSYQDYSAKGVGFRLKYEVLDC